MSNLTSLSELTAHCIRCGFCLESCPTFTETGRETDSPRGRIYLVRSAIEGHLAWSQEDVGQYLDPCLGCRACETACPSGVEYGKVLELAREAFAKKQGIGGRQRLLKLLTSPRLLRFGMALGRLLPAGKVPRSIGRLASRERPEADRPRAQKLSAWPPLPDPSGFGNTRFPLASLGVTGLSPAGQGGEDQDSLPPVRGKVYLLEGCAMRVLFPNVHLATRRLLRRVGFEVQDSGAGCCGALHAHQGLLEEGVLMLRGTEGDMSENLPIVVNSAGCGSFMKEHASSARGDVFDVSEFLLANGLVELLNSIGQRETTPPGPRGGSGLQNAGFDDPPRGRGGVSSNDKQGTDAPTDWQAERGSKSPQTELRVAYHDACHLIHGQKVFREPRELLAAVPGIELVDLPESDTCCGSAGIYNLSQPKMARRLLERKWRSVEASGADIVVLGNPGCHAWIAQAAREKGSRVRVMHTVELLEAAFSGLEGLGK